ncbi:GvpL/GvpF family gas vesicle protein [Pseudobacillus wudalianchiensis]|uniref:Gas vesicle protein GvpL n=1 Tax=Pseudobacillus wudalianchiensis TaxID=1743143 RepID=A0A1B9B7Q5_9BACI|nr:GvpL/GvpF family gas vesicle protein [Bacillus wudalianchiensis]OCA92118.1 gas vesicle protein GvpL [Bacillus wudalianchiensis]
MDRLIYLYGLIPRKEEGQQPLPPLKGFDGTDNLYTIPIGDITAVVCQLDPEKYSEESIKERVNDDMEWLQEKAFHHHETVMALSKIFTVIPLKFCTLYKNPDSLKRAVQSNRSNMLYTFDLIAGHEEWNLKMYCNDQLLKKQVSGSNPVIEAKREEISQLSKGKQFFEKKKLDKLIESQLEEEKNKISENIHLHLKELARKGDVKKAWSAAATARKEDMAWNGVYLVEKSKVERFLEQIQQYEKELRENGWQLEASGPWPAYHFSSFS